MESTTTARKIMKWTLQLISPNGEVFEIEEFGYASPTQEHLMILGRIRDYVLENHPDEKLLIADIGQSLLNENFHYWHPYRLSWGDTNPEEGSASYPDGVNRVWKFTRFLNGRRTVLLTGELPSNWWELARGERQCLAQEALDHGN